MLPNISKVVFSEVKYNFLFPRRNISDSCKLLIVGGGSGGIPMAAKFSKKLKDKEIILIEPNDLHYYQPIFTLIGGGMKIYNDSYKKTKDLIPKNVKWLKDSVAHFNPDANIVKTELGKEIKYDFLIIALGLTLRYEEIPGLVQALEDNQSGVCSIYSPKYVQNVYKNLQNFQSGNAIFTFPASPVKCPGAPQKICYITEHFLRKENKKSKANIYYNTALPVIFGVEKYAKALWNVANSRNITVNLNTNLVEVNHKNKEAIFEDLKTPGSKNVMKYSLLHVTPPQKTPEVLRKTTSLVNELGFLNVDKSTLKHVKYPNIYGIGDCTNTPNSKTLAAVAAQSGVVYQHLLSDMNNQKSTKIYDGYASCPLVTGYNTCILAEFDYTLTPKETFPIRQDRESWLMFQMKKEIMPILYWKIMLNGYWNGPESIRKILRLGF